MIFVEITTPFNGFWENGDAGVSENRTASAAVDVSGCMLIADMFALIFC